MKYLAERLGVEQPTTLVEDPHANLFHCRIIEKIVSRYFTVEERGAPGTRRYILATSVNLKPIDVLIGMSQENRARNKRRRRIFGLRKLIQISPTRAQRAKIRVMNPTNQTTVPIEKRSKTVPLEMSL